MALIVTNIRIGYKVARLNAPMSRWGYKIISPCRLYEPVKLPFDFCSYHTQTVAQ